MLHNVEIKLSKGKKRVVLEYRKCSGTYDIHTQLITGRKGQRLKALAYTDQGTVIAVRDGDLVVQVERHKKARPMKVANIRTAFYYHQALGVVRGNNVDTLLEWKDGEILKCEISDEDLADYNAILEIGIKKANENIKYHRRK